MADIAISRFISFGNNFFDLRDRNAGKRNGLLCFSSFAGTAERYRRVAALLAFNIHRARGVDATHSLIKRA